MYAKWLQLDELYQFTSVGNDQYEITKFLLAESNISELYLPSKYNGGVITTIGSGAFAGCSSLTPVVIPGNVITIRGSAFYNCNNLNKNYLKKNQSLPSGTATGMTLTLRFYIMARIGNTMQTAT